MPDRPSNTYLTEWVSEIRYEPLGSFLNFKGSLADRIKKKYRRFKHWRISENRVDFYNEKNKGEISPDEQAFVGFRNVGYILARPHTSREFPERANNFLQAVFSNDAEFSLPAVGRVGIRAISVFPCDMTLLELTKVCNKKLLYSPQSLEEMAGLPITDLGVTLEFIVKKKQSLRFTCGPMPQEQIKRRLRVHDDCPEVGLFVDVDIFRNLYDEYEKYELKQIQRLIEEYSNLAWEFMEKLKDFILSQEKN